jgi:AcrR family transcriptional regulator
MTVKPSSRGECRVVEAEKGRYRQRRRTRDGIVTATAALLEAGESPSVNEIADAADVSRRTVYQYFPTLEQLLIDATLFRLSQAAVDEAIDAAGADGDPSERVAAMIRALAAMSAETLPLGRALIRLTTDAPRPDGQPRRGFRRVGWIERALDPIRPRLSPAEFERLVSALAMVVGWEALIVLGDVRGLSEQEQLDTALWTARTLIRAALDEADG